MHLREEFINHFTDFFKKVFDSLWMDVRDDLWDTSIEWIRSRDPVSPYQITTILVKMIYHRGSSLSEHALPI